jgi:hypothetical protein
MLETLREISDPNAPPPPAASAQAVSMSQSEKENSVVGFRLQKKLPQFRSLAMWTYCSPGMFQRRDQRRHNQE